MEAFALEGGPDVVALHQAGVAEHAVNPGGADGDDVGVRHPEGQPPVTLPGYRAWKLRIAFFSPSSWCTPRGSDPIRCSPPPQNSWVGIASPTIGCSLILGVP